MKRLGLLFACLTLSMAACSDESPVAVGNLDGGDPALIPEAPKSAPFHVAWVTSAGDPPAVECLVPEDWVSIGIFGEGDATHMGPTLMESIIFGELVPPGDPGGQTGCAEITADNGDELYQVYDEGTATFIFPILTGSGTWYWDGGTGRFASATGSGTYEFFFNGITQQGVLTVDGTISR
jgi:hypothetical protein